MFGYAAPREGDWDGFYLVENAGKKYADRWGSKVKWWEEQSDGKTVLEQTMEIGSE